MPRRATLSGLTGSLGPALRAGVLLAWVLLACEPAPPPPQVAGAPPPGDAAPVDPAGDPLERALQRVEDSPRSVEAWLELGRLREDARDPDGAEAALDRALALQPRQPTALSRRALLRARRDLRAAIADAERARELDPQLPAAHRALAGLRLGEGRLEDAQAELTAAIDLDPQNGDLYVGRALVHLNRGNLEAALTDSLRAVELVPGKADAWANLGGARMRLQEFKGALEAYDRAVELDPLNPDAWGFRAAVREQLGDVRGALGDMAHAHGLLPPGDPRLRTANDALRRLLERAGER